MPVPFAFSAATSAIPLSQLDTNFNTTITLGNTAIQLGNTVTTLNNMTLANVTISSGNVTLTNVTVTTANVTTANITTAIIATANVTTANVATSIITTSETLSYGTTNGVAYLNGSKVLTTGSALTFDGTNLGNSQNTASPIGAVLNNSNASTSAGTRVLFQYSGTATGYVLNQFDGSDFNNKYQANQHHIWINGSNEQMRLTSTGLGIGTSSPSYKLDVAGVIRSNTGIKSITASGGQPEFVLDQSGVASWTIYNPPSNTALRFYNGVDRMTLDSSGNLGLGVTPSAWGTNEKALQIGNSLSLTRGSSSEAVLAYNAYVNSIGTYLYNITANSSRYEQLAGQHRWYTAPSGTAGNAITFTQAMTLDASGNLLVGTTSALYGGERLAVNGASGSIGQTIYANGTSSIGLLLYSSIATGATSGKQVSFVRNDGVEVGSITSNGSATAYNINSDQRLKKNIVGSPAASSLIDDIQVRSFDWKADGSHQRYGFIAQELVAVAPEAVYQPVNPDEMMGVDYSKLVPMLVKEIQSLRQRVAQLEGK